MFARTLRTWGTLGRGLALALPIVVAAAAWEGPVYAGTVSQDIEAAEQAYANLDFDKANKMADALSKQRSLTHEQLVRVYRVLARSHAVLDHEALARDTFTLLLAYDPDYAGDPNLGPKVTGPFMEARGFWRGQPARPGLDVSTSVRAQEGGVLRVTTRDPTHLVRRVSVGTRWGMQPYAVSSVAAGESVSVDIPAAPRGTARLEYFAQALDERDSVVFEIGNPGGPKTLIVETTTIAPAGQTTPSSQKSSVSPWWFVLGAGVVAGAATGIYFATRKDAETTTTTFSPVLNCGAERCR